MRAVGRIARRAAQHALIIANGPLPSAPLVRRLCALAGLIVCADGGANWARRYRIEPDVILGDLDSLTAATKRYYRERPILRIADQESTDLEKAIRHCLRAGMISADVIGALGGRVDHITGSLGCFRRFGNRISLRFLDNTCELTAVGKTVTVKAAKRETISLIPVDRCTGVTVKNLKYGLRNDVLETGVREGISNEATGTRVTVTVRKGTLLLYRLRQ